MQKISLENLGHFEKLPSNLFQSTKKISHIFAYWKKHFEQFVITGYQPLCNCAKTTLRPRALLPPHLFLSACVAIYACLCIFRAACTLPCCAIHFYMLVFKSV